jgi:aspartate aminotransferase
MAKRKLFPWFDIAYQGFSSGDPDEDAWAVREFASRGFEMFVCQSYAKNFGLYCERVGALHVIAADKGSAAAVLTHIEVIARPMYSNPPAHGARVVAHVLASPELNAEWRAELGAAMKRVQGMRAALKAALVARGTPGTWEHITEQTGMFSFTGLSPSQSERMVEDFHVYMLKSGRINVAGLSAATIDTAADAIHAVVTDAKANPDKE